MKMVCEGQNSWELSAMRGRGLPQIRINPVVTSEVISIRKLCLMMDDEGCMRRGMMYKKKAVVNLMGWSFLCISGEYVKGCWHSCTPLLPCPCHTFSKQKNKPKLLNQEVHCLILCELISWFWGEEWEKISYPLNYKNNIWSLRLTCSLWLVGGTAFVTHLACNQAQGSSVTHKNWCFFTVVLLRNGVGWHHFQRQIGVARQHK